MKNFALTLLLCTILFFNCFSQQKKINVIGYYFANRETLIDSYPLEKLTHLIFSFTHLKENKININNKRDSAILSRIIALRNEKYPHLKIQVALGGWGGCATCSNVFETEEGRNEFAVSVKKLITDFGIDGLDLDWEYPAIQGPPGHAFSTKDKDNFAELVKTLRKELGTKKEISFAAGGFNRYLNESIDWDKTMKYVDRVNIMSYDLGSDRGTGHHTLLYSNSVQKESADNIINRLINEKKVAPKKIVIGAAFYARAFNNVDSANNGLYQSGRSTYGSPYRNFNTVFSADSGFIKYRDSTAQAPYLYSKTKKTFATFDDSTSVSLKTNYAIEHNLNGIMFWQLAEDNYFGGGLLDAIDETIKHHKNKRH